MTMDQVNAQLISIARRHADGELDRPGFRQQRRSLICQAMGLPEPQLPPEHDAAGPSEDDTMPGGTAVHVPLETSRNAALDPAAVRNHKPAPAVAEPVADDAAAAAPAAAADKRKTAIFAVTIVLFLLAFAGLAGLAWFILR